MCLKGMRVLSFTDIHEDVYLAEKLAGKSMDVDVVVCCGDLSSFGWRLRETAEKLSVIDKLLLIVPGNNETSSQVDELCDEYGWINLHGKRFRVGGYVFAGVGGSTFTPFRTPFELGEEEIEKTLEGFRGIDSLVLVTHSPPHGTGLDKVLWKVHVGSRAIRRFVEEEQPIINLCGHVHEKSGVEERIGRTRVLNPGRTGFILEL